jgi:hypothetical protein
MSFLYLARNDIHEPVRSDQDLKHAGFKDAPVSLHTAICSMWRRGLLHRLRGFDLF